MNRDEMVGVVAGLLIILLIAALGLLPGCAAAPAEPEWTTDVDVWAGLATPAKVDRNPKWEDARICLAQVVYGEARGEMWEGQVAVAQVVLRRAGLDYRNACVEAHKPSQFAPAAAPRSAEAWAWSLAAADAALAWAARAEGLDYSNRATYFHSGQRRPYWTRGLETVASIGGHYFYR